MAAAQDECSCPRQGCRPRALPPGAGAGGLAAHAAGGGPNSRTAHGSTSAGADGWQRAARGVRAGRGLSGRLGAQTVQQGTCRASAVLPKRWHGSRKSRCPGKAMRNASGHCGAASHIVQRMAGAAACGALLPRTCLVVEAHPPAQPGEQLGLHSQSVGRATVSSRRRARKATSRQADASMHTRLCFLSLGPAGTRACAAYRADTGPQRSQAGCAIDWPRQPPAAIRQVLAGPPPARPPGAPSAGRRRRASRQ